MNHNNLCPGCYDDSSGQNPCPSCGYAPANNTGAGLYLTPGTLAPKSGIKAIKKVVALTAKPC